MRTSPSSSWTPVTSGWRKPAYLGRGGGAPGQPAPGPPAPPAEPLSPQTDGTGRFVGMPGTNGEPRWLTEDEQQAWRATVHLSQLLLRQLDRDLNVHGLNGHDYEILVELSEAPDNRLRMTATADATSQSRSRLSHQISRMESRGLVRRDTCEGDKRGTFAVLTEPGMDAIRRVAPDHVDNVRRHFIDWLSPRQLEEVGDAFGPIVDYLRKIRDRDLAPRSVGATRKRCEPAVCSRRLGQPAIERGQRSAQHLCQRYVPRVVAGDVVPKCPYPRGEGFVRKELHRQVEQVAIDRKSTRLNALAKPQHLCQRYVPRVVAGDVVPKCPYPRGEGFVRKELHRQVEQVA